jgi:hypothetical protein
MQTRIFKRAPQVSDGGMKSMKTGETQKYIRTGGGRPATEDTEGHRGRPDTEVVQDYIATSARILLGLARVKECDRAIARFVISAAKS